MPLADDDYTLVARHGMTMFLFNGYFDQILFSKMVLNFGLIIKSYF